MRKIDLRNLAFNVSFNGNDDAIVKMDRATDDLKKSVGDTSDSLDDMGKSLDGSTNTKNIEGMESATDKLDKKADKTTKNLASMEKSFDKTGKSLTKKVTAPILALGTAAIHTVTGFDDSMSQVRAISGATGDDFDALRDKAKQLGADTAFSASQAADGMSTLAAAGLKPDEMLGTIGQSLTLASAGSMELDAAAGMITGTMAQFELGLKDTDMIMDTLVKGANSADTNVSEMGEAFKYAGGVANNMNMSVGQASAVLGVFANAQIKGGQAGTTFASMYTDLTNKVKDGNIAIGNSAVEVYDSLGNMRDMGSIMSDIESATQGMTDAQKDAAVGAVFTGQSMKGVNAFLTQGADAYRELESTVLDSAGAAQKASDDIENNIGGAFREMGSAIEGFMIDMGDVFKDDVKKVAEGIGNLASMFGKLPDGTKKAIVGVMGVAAALGPLLWGGSKVMGLMSKGPAIIDGVGKAFAFLTSPVGLIIGAIALLAVGFVTLYNKNEEFRDKVNGIWDNIKTIIGGAVEWISAKWGEHGEAIVSVATSVFGIVTDTISIWLNTMVDMVGGVVTVLGGLIEFLVGIFTGNWSRAWDGLGTMVGGAIDIIKGYWDGLKELFKKPLTGIVNIFKKDKSDVSAADNIDGSHYSGLAKVPFDGYRAELHKNEEVLTANDPRNQNNPNPGKPNPVSGTGGMKVIYNPSISITVGEGTTEKEKSNLKKEMEETSRRMFNEFFAELNLKMS